MSHADRIQTVAEGQLAKARAFAAAGDYRRANRYAANARRALRAAGRLNSEPAPAPATSLAVVFRAPRHDGMARNVA